MVTDFDCWHPDHEHVQVADIVRVLTDNAEKAKTLVSMVAPILKDKRPDPCPSGCDRALEHALITAPAARSPDMIARLDAVAGRILKK
jgi:5'-methylthioadenosine phosphorylase